MCLPCKRCSCCGSREYLQTVLAFSMKETAQPNPEAFSHYSNRRPVITALPVSSRPTSSEVGEKVHLEAGGFYSLTVLSLLWKLHMQLYRVCPFPRKYYLVILNFWSMLSILKKKKEQNWLCQTKMNKSSFEDPLYLEKKFSISTAKYIHWNIL